MTPRLESLPEHRLGLIRSVGRLAARFGERAYLVGGTVRDLLLRRPSDDLDIVVEGDALRLAWALAGAEAGGATIHERFGTASVLVEGVRIDLAAARSETYAAPAALPTVVPGKILADLRRRDFTINAMAIRLDPAGFGRLVDPFGGRRDLGLRTIRILHDRSFVDDPTRAFRAIRLAAWLEFELAPGTRDRLRAAVRQRGFERLTAARLRKEVARAFAGPRADEVVRRLARSGLLRAIHPTLTAPRAARARLERCGKERAHTWAIGLAVLLYESPRSVRESIATRLAVDRRIRFLLVEGPARAPRVVRRLSGPRAERASFIYEVCRPEPAELLLLAAALAPHRAVARARIARYLEELREIRAQIGGNDLIRAGVAEGPRIARGLAAALRARLDGRAPDAATQLRVALRAAGSA